jgi:hypothetical protein
MFNKTQPFMICPINKNVVASLLLATFFSVNIYAQEAEKIYHNEFSKFSFVLQPSILESSEAQNSDGSTYPSMNFTNDFSWQFGFYYNFAQSGNFNFKTGLIAKEFTPKFDLNISNEDIGYGIEYYLTDYDAYNQFIISIPFKTDYYLKINPKLNFVIGAGLNLDIITGGFPEMTTSVTVWDYSDNSKDIFFAKSNHENITFSGEISAGFNYKTKYALWDLSFFYNKNFGPAPATGEYYIYNLEISPDKEGTFEIESNFYGFSLAISPKKGWLKKKP